MWIREIVAKIISTAETKKSQPFSKKRLMAVVAVVATIAVGATTISMLMKPASPKQPTGLQKAMQSDELLAKANFWASHGQYDEAVNNLKKAVEAMTDKNDKAFGYIQLSSLAYTNNKYEDTYQFAKQSESISPTQSSAQMMAEAAAKLGRKDEALEKFNLAITRVTGTDEGSLSDKRSLESKIAALKAQ